MLQTKHAWFWESLLGNERKGMAASYLGTMGAAGKDSVPALLRASHQDLGGPTEICARAQCARAVLRIQGESSEAISVLAEALAFKSNSWVRATVAEDIGALGSIAIPLIPALQRALQDPDREVRHEAALALAKLESIKREIDSTWLR